jgi:hypothetical protein
MSFGMNALHKFKRPASHFVGSLPLALLAVMGMPFLLSSIKSSRFWGMIFFSKGPR